MDEFSAKVVETVNAYWARVNSRKSRSEADFATAVWLFTKGVKESTVRRLFETDACNLSQKYRERLAKGNGARAYLDLTVRKAMAVSTVSQDDLDPSRYRLDGLEASDLASVPVTLLGKTGLPGLVGLSVIAGPPSVTKSWFALGCARDVIKSGKTVLILDYENGIGRTKARLRKLFPEYYTDEDYKTRLFYWDGREFSGDKLRGLISKIMPDLLVIDPLQKLSQSTSNYFTELRQWIGFLEDLKKDSSMVILGVSQVRRESYEDAGIGSGFGSSAIEYNADLVMSLQRKGDFSICRITKYRDDRLDSYVIKLRFGEAGLELADEITLVEEGNV